MSDESVPNHARSEVRRRRGWTHGWRFHGHRPAFERDRARDAELQLLGYTVLRFTWHTGAATATATIARFLSRPASRKAS